MMAADFEISGKFDHLVEKLVEFHQVTISNPIKSGDVRNISNLMNPLTLTLVSLISDDFLGLVSFF